MSTTEGVQCGWAGCPVEFRDELSWIKHVAIHVFTLKPGERTPWLGPPELDPDCNQDNLSDVEEDDDDRAFSEINALSSPASTPPQVGLPDSPDLSQKINGPSVSMVADVEPLRLLQSPGELEHVLSHRSSSSTDDVEADLVPTSPAPSSINASQNSNSNRNDSRSPHLFSRGPSMQTQSPFPASGVNRFRRGTLQIRSPAQASVRFGSALRTPQSQDRPIASQTLRSPDNEQVGATSLQSQGNGSGMSWLNTQAFRPPAETQELYESD